MGLLDEDIDDFSNGVRRSGGHVGSSQIYKTKRSKPDELHDPSGYYMLEGTKSGAQLKKKGVKVGMTALDVAKKLKLPEFAAKLQSASGSGGSASSGGGGSGAGGGSSGGGKPKPKPKPKATSEAKASASSKQKKDWTMLVISGVLDDDFVQFKRGVAASGGMVRAGHSRPAVAHPCLSTGCSPALPLYRLQPTPTSLRPTIGT